MELKELDGLIRYHKDGLSQYRLHISPSAQYLEEQTIKALEELREHIVEVTSSRIREAREILSKRQTQED